MPEISSSAVVLLSSGLDSAFNLMKAVEQFRVVLALTFDYGQRAAPRERERAARLAKHFHVNHRVIELPWFREFTGSTLINRAAPVPSGEAVDIESVERSQQTARAVWVPNRNGIFLNIAAGFAEGLGAKYIIPGFNLEEAQTFPDNSGAYMKALDESFAFSTQNRVTTLCYSTHLNKTQIVKEALRTGLPFKMLWPCYLDGEEWCGACESCQRFLRALKENGVTIESLK